MQNEIRNSLGTMMTTRKRVFTPVYSSRSSMGASQVLCLTQHHINLGIGVYMYVALLPPYSDICYLIPCTSSGAMSEPAAYLASCWPSNVIHLKPALSGSLPNQSYISPILKGFCCQHNAQVSQGTLQTAACDERCEEGIVLARRRWRRVLEGLGQP